MNYTPIIQEVIQKGEICLASNEDMEQSKRFAYREQDVVKDTQYPVCMKHTIEGQEYLLFFIATESGDPVCVLLGHYDETTRINGDICKFEGNRPMTTAPYKNILQRKRVGVVV